MTKAAALALTLALAACADKPTSPEPARNAAPTASAPSPAVCTPGADQTCNDDPAISSLHGTCNPDRTCTCHGSFEKNPRTGRCK